MVLGQKGSGQMVRTKWYGQNGIRTKWYTDKMVYGQNGIRTKWYGLNGIDKIINQYINPAPTDNIIF